MDKFKININYGVLILGLIFTMVTIALIYFFKNETKIETYVSIIGTGITLTTLAYTAMNVHLIYKNNLETLKHEKKKYAATLISEFNSPEMMKLSILGEVLKKDIEDLNAKEVIRILEKKNEMRVAINSLLNFHEKVAISIEHDLADETLLKDFFQGIVRSTYTVLSEFITLTRKKMHNNDVFISFERLAKRWN